MKEFSIADFHARYGPWAIVAGSSEGMGAEFAAQLAGKGLNLILVARDGEKLVEKSNAICGQYGVQVRFLSLDLADEEAPSALATFTQDLEIGLLVYNAAFSSIGPFWERSLEDHLKELEVNCRAPLVLTYKIGQGLIKRGRGGIILMSSLSASQGSAFISNYAATKAYNLILAEGLWEELRDRGVDVLACCPGATRTPNYLASLIRQQSRGNVPAMEPSIVVAETLAALGKKPSVIPGRINRWSAVLMRRALPRQMSIQLMGRVLRGMYL